MAGLRIAWFSQLNSAADGGSGSKSEYFSRLVVPLLKQRHVVDCFGENVCDLGGISVSCYKSFFKKHRQNFYDLCFYQLEDSSGNVFVRNVAKHIPGVLYCHDFYSTLDISDFPKNSKSRSRVVWCQPEVLGTFRVQSDDTSTFYNHCLKGLIRLFATERNLGDFLEFAQFDGMDLEQIKTYYLPFAVGKSVVTQTRKGEYFYFCGGVESEYRTLKVFEALSSIPNIKLRWLVDPFEQQQALSLVNENQFNFIEVLVGRTPEKWQELMKDAQGAILTLFSASRDLEPYTSISLGAGVPTIVTDFAHAATLPKEIVYCIEAGYEENVGLVKAVNSIVHNEPRKASSIAPNEYIEELHAPEVVADQISNILTSHAEYLKKALGKWTRYNILDPFLEVDPNRKQLDKGIYCGGK